MDSHQQKVENLCVRLRDYKGDRPISLQKDSISHSVPRPNNPKGGDNRIYIGGFDEILRIDKKKWTCVAEPGVTFSALVQETLKHGLAPMLVPELKDITVGGAVSGCSVESMSYKYGGFHDSCLEYEIVTPEGEILICNREQNTDVFHMIHGSFGTLGIITKLTFNLIPAKPFVKLTYKKFDNVNSYFGRILMEYATGNGDFVDGIVHSDKEFVLCLGTFAEEAPFVSSYGVNGPYYKSAREKEVDYMRTYDYFFRYDSDCHWLARNFGLENKVLRRIAGKWLLGSTQLIKWAKRLNFLLRAKKPDVIIDVFIPASKFAEFFEFYSRENYYPLWVVPYKISRRYPWINPSYWKGMMDELFIDCAIYGMKQGNRNYYKELEEKVRELRGIKTLISYNYEDEEAFWKMFNREEYQQIKNRLDPKGKLKDIYAKTH